MGGRVMLRGGCAGSASKMCKCLLGTRHVLPFSGGCYPQCHRGHCHNHSALFLPPPPSCCVYQALGLLWGNRADSHCFPPFSPSSFSSFLSSSFSFSSPLPSLLGFSAPTSLPLRVLSFPTLSSIKVYKTLVRNLVFCPGRSLVSNPS